MATAMAQRLSDDCNDYQIMVAPAPVGQPGPMLVEGKHGAAVRGSTGAEALLNVTARVINCTRLSKLAGCSVVINISSQRSASRGRVADVDGAGRGAPARLTAGAAPPGCIPH